MHSALVAVEIEQQERERLEKSCADISAYLSAQLEDRMRTEQYSGAYDEEFWTRFCAVCLCETTDTVSAVVAAQDTESKEFQAWVDLLASNIDFDASMPVTTVGESLLKVLVSRLFSLELGNMCTIPQS